MVLTIIVRLWTTLNTFITHSCGGFINWIGIYIVAIYIVIIFVNIIT